MVQNRIATRFRVEASFVEEYGESDLDHWSTDINYFETLHDATDVAEAYSVEVIHFEIFDPSTKTWEHLFVVPTECAKSIEVASDL